MAVTLPALDRLVPETAAALDRDGFVCLADGVSADWVERARAHVEGHLDRHGHKFFSIIRPADEAGSPFDELAHDPQIQGLIRGLTERACPQGVIEHEDVYNVLRIIAGPDGASGSHEYHYDASVVTMVVPVLMPDYEPGRSGELVAFGNARGYRGSVLTNLAEKVAIQNRLGWKRARARIMGPQDPHVRVLKPGNIYLFWGYRTLHGNLPCRPDIVRATMLLHYGNPHGNDPLLRAIRAVRGRVERRRLNTA